MAEQSPAHGAEPPVRPRALAPLGADLGAKERAFADHLRGLRERAGKTSTDLAAALCVDPTRFSRFLSGQSLPEPQLLTRFHRLLTDGEPDASTEEAVRKSRALLYAAARTRGPLSTRAYEIAELREKLHEQQNETARSLEALQNDLQDERERRHRAEREIERLQQTRTVGSEEQLRRVEAERDHALRRVAELEDLVAQTGALVRLQQDDARHVQEMAQATEGELQAWEDGVGSLPPLQDGLVPWPSELAGITCQSAVEALAELRDVDDESADQALHKIANEAPPETFGRFYRLLIDHGRRLDANRLLGRAAEYCDGLRLRQLVVGTQTLREAPGVTVGSGESTFTVPDSTYEDNSCGDALTRSIGWRTPAPQFIRLMHALAERGEHQPRGRLLRIAANRQRAERRLLREAGLPVPGPVGKLLYPKA
ncbi:helix-turn-helix domain-containing protein [Streptomyces sp. NPDC029674]|uniref:helix-turn-helix domain-containing protein n=1 Tax=Streptomyces sp. NPDC029674 TaxID=3365297 RepID=UPI00384F6005